MSGTSVSVRIYTLSNNVERSRDYILVQWFSGVTGIGFFEFKQCVLYVQMHLLALCFYWECCVFVLFLNAGDNSVLKQWPLDKIQFEMRRERERGFAEIA